MNKNKNIKENIKKKCCEGKKLNNKIAVSG